MHIHSVQPADKLLRFTPCQTITRQTVIEFPPPFINVAHNQHKMIPVVEDKHQCTALLCFKDSVAMLTEGSFNTGIRSILPPARYAWVGDESGWTSFSHDLKVIVHDIGVQPSSLLKCFL
eukprot:TRINITY_DN6235_c2_g1_i1.p1 TRINITY_DN6235_c2_g1~~TRINITY_DN6235_c2_g1_i1.p1  ORF type:complete len:120 (+),score=14.61 TRINITY_DN6235_c2_g1_i1:50-409(+)